MKGNLVEIGKNIEAALRWLKRGRESLDGNDPDTTLMYLTVGSAEAKRAREKLFAEIREEAPEQEKSVVSLPAGAFRFRPAIVGRMVAVAGFLLIGFTISHFADQAKIARMEEKYLAQLHEIRQNPLNFSDNPTLVPPGQREYISGEGGSSNSGSATPGEFLNNASNLVVEFTRTLADLRERNAVMDDTGNDPAGMHRSGADRVSVQNGGSGSRGGFVSPFPIVEVEPVSFPLRSNGSGSPGEARSSVPAMGDFNQSG